MALRDCDEYNLAYHTIFSTEPTPLEVAFVPPGLQTVPEANALETVCFDVSGSILAPFSVTVVIDQPSSTATFGKFPLLPPALASLPPPSFWRGREGKKP